MLPLNPVSCWLDRRVYLRKYHVAAATGWSCKSSNAEREKSSIVATWINSVNRSNESRTLMGKFLDFGRFKAYLFNAWPGRCLIQLEILAASLLNTIANAMPK